MERPCSDHTPATDQQLNLCVLVDPGEPKRRRGTFWHSALGPWLDSRPGRRSVYLEEISWVEEMRRRRWLRFSRFEVIVLNWGVVNGNPMFEADVSQELARRYGPQLREFVARGGLLVVECQADNWVLQQDAYDAILVTGGLPRLRVLTDTHNGLFGKWVTRPRYPVGHAQRLFEGLDEVVRVDRPYSRPSGRWFPAGSVPGRTVEVLRATRDRLYTGAFRRAMPRKWQPVLFTEDRRFPVACVFHERGEGAYLATTMHLASCGARKLLRPITVDWPDSRRRLNQ